MFSGKQFYKRITSSSLGKSTGIYTICSFINSAIPLALLPILTTELSPSDYGIIAMFQLAVSIIYPFIGINLEGSITRKFYDNDADDFSSYIGSCFFLFLVSSVVLLLINYFFQAYLYDIFQIPRQWIKYALLVAGCQFVTTVVLNLFQVKVQPFRYGIFQILQSLLNVMLTLYFIVVKGKTWDGRLEAQIGAGVVFALIAIIILITSKQIDLRIKIKDIKHALKFGVPLVPHAIGAIMFTAIDRFFLTRLVGWEQTGNYTVAFQLGAVISLATAAFNNAYVPWLFENLKKNEISIKRRIVKFTYLYFVILLFGSFILLMIFPFVVSVFVGKSFSSVNMYAGFIVFGFVFQGMYYMVTNYIIFAQKTYMLAIATITVGLLKIPLTYFSISFFGPIGAGISYCFTFLIYFLITWILSSKVYKMPWFAFAKS